MSHSPDVNSVIDAIPGRTLPASASMTGFALMGVGVLAIAYGFLVAGAAWTWGALLVAIMVGFAAAQGGIIFAIIQTGTWGRWGRPLKRIGESFAFMLPVMYVALLVFLLLGVGIYPWNPDTFNPGGVVDLHPHSPAAISSKPLWLSKWFFIGRQALAMALLVGLDFVYLRASLRPDMIQAKARLGDKAPKWWDMFIGGKTDLKAAVESGQATQSALVPVLGLAYGLIFSLLAFDLVMSLSPWWYTNLFGAWIAVSSFWMSLAVLAIVTNVTKNWLGIAAFIKPNVTHDLGKLMLAGCMFWAYNVFSQILPIWYGQIPEETDYLLVRLYLPTWSWMSQTVAVLCFIAPFTILLSRGVKKMRWPFVGVSALIVFGIFMERSLLVLPNVYLEEAFPALNFIIVNIGILLGLIGVFISVIGRVLASIPPLVTSDPYLEDHPWEVHVHSLDAAHH